VDGVLVLDKPEGPTSHDVVARARRALRVRAIGHTGTLDPMATGVLVLVVGRATRLAQFLSGHRKAYDAVLRLGLVPAPWDRPGPGVGGRGAPLPALAQVERALESFVGVQLQTPPPYSAKKVDGVRAHVLARRGSVVAVEPARVELHRARVTGADFPLVSLTIETSAGYYVRSLVHELGQVLGCGACLEALRRTSSGEFGLAQALVPMGRLLPELPAVVLDEAAARRAEHGNEILTPAGDAQAPASDAAAVRLLAPDGSLLAIARPTGRPGVLHPAVVLK
jgi:tRNA pseudouridine55 synthase